MENARKESHGSASHQDNHRKRWKKGEAGNGRILVRQAWNRTPLARHGRALTTEEVNYYVDTIAAVVKDEIGID